MRTLFEAGKGAGKLEAEEIALALDELDLDPAQLDEFYTALEEAQVDIVGNEQSEAEAEKEWASEAEISTDTLQLFLKDIGKVPLLTAAQEVELSKRIELGEEQLFYLMSRGLSEAEASAMIVAGFVEPITKELPLEYAVEMNRLIQLQMEGSVG